MTQPDRRLFLATLAAGGASLIARPSIARAVNPTCGAATPPNIEGPFYKPNAPTLNRDGVVALDRNKGKQVYISGLILDRSCRPIVGASIEFWQADHKGKYDHKGFHMRGRTRSMSDKIPGYFQLLTIQPGRYLNGSKYRPSHIHVKVHKKGHRPLTTQLYFPDDPYNKSDPFFRPGLVMKRTVPNEHGCQAPSYIDYRFNFVLS